MVLILVLSSWSWASHFRLAITDICEHFSKQTVTTQEVVTCIKNIVVSSNYRIQQFMVGKNKPKDKSDRKNFTATFSMKFRINW